jgi:hypothetical protein
VQRLRYGQLWQWQPELNVNRQPELHRHLWYMLLIANRYDTLWACAVCSSTLQLLLAPQQHRLRNSSTMSASGGHEHLQAKAPWRRAAKTATASAQRDVCFRLWTQRPLAAEPVQRRPLVNAMDSGLMPPAPNRSASQLRTASPRSTLSSVAAAQWYTALSGASRWWLESSCPAPG